ncbi:SDR family oxidoreductase [Rossellomorea aquimaris]|uniref:elongation factor P 5-aminopentanone reductase n=1 Tax=Rossellomorea aquimaris TaxID=189382 RepID=UPI001CD74D7D|nr:SDR family oxidoreductase [Rossellomorea aquimaris]MCA1053579.1 SDR family oxidoreductase [Rossellomorea aquimaris]
MKFALITGASGGIGRSTALTLAKKGWNLYLHYHSDRDGIEDLMTEITNLGVEAIPIQADLTQPEQVQSIIDSIFRIDAIVYASGVAGWGLFQDQSELEMDRMINIHVKSPMLLIQGLLPNLLKNKGNIVIVSSIWGQIGGACEVIYSTVKGAQLSFVKALAKETAPSGVRINSVAPGAVATNMMESFSEEDLLQVSDEIPMGRLANSKEIASSICFLLSDDASYITGQTLAVNGGWHT